MAMFLDRLPLTGATVGFGKLGTDGDLGYEGSSVKVAGKPCAHALSAHAPSHLTFDLAGGYQRFECRVAFNDDVRGRPTSCHFAVRLDGEEVASAPLVRPGDEPVTLRADVTSGRTLELIALTDRFDYCHSVWIDPVVTNEAPAEPSKTELADPLERVSFPVPNSRRRVDTCIATVVTGEFEKYLEDFIMSLKLLGDIPEAHIVVFAIDIHPRCRDLLEGAGVDVIDCQLKNDVNVSIKSALYSIARVVHAERYLCIDADTLILGSLRPVLAAIDVAPPGRILVCREANHTGWDRLGTALRHTYFGRDSDLRRILGTGADGEADYPLVVNDGVFAGGFQAMLALDGTLRSMPNGIAWMEEKQRVCWWRNQFLFNLALARLNAGWELDNTFNVQLHTHDVDWHPGTNGDSGKVRFRGRAVKILHLCGGGKQKYLEPRRRFRESLQQRFGATS